MEFLYVFAFCLLTPTGEQDCRKSTVVTESEAAWQAAVADRFLNVSRAAVEHGPAVVDFHIGCLPMTGEAT